MRNPSKIPSPFRSEFPPDPANLSSPYAPTREEARTFFFVAVLGAVLLVLALGLVSDQIADFGERVLRAVPR